MKPRARRLTPADVERFEKCEPQVKGLYEEIGQLAKKSPNDGVNKFKLRLINKALGISNDILSDQHRPFPDFATFNEDELPTNSDVAVILSQYLISLKYFRSINIEWSEEDEKWRWIVSGEQIFPAAGME